MCVFLVVLHSGDYYLFESDSEDEDVFKEEQKYHKQTAFQVKINKQAKPTETRYNIVDIIVSVSCH